MEFGGDHMESISKVRPSPIAGSWYPRNPVKLKQTIETYLSTARIPPFKGRVIGLIAPHAGHIYSGATAAYAFKTVSGAEYDLVVVLSPYHQFHMAPILVSAHSYYETPLGQIEIDRQAVDLLDNLLQKKGLSITPILYDKEHSLEIELPFLQCALKKPFKILPIMLRAQDAATTQVIAESLAEILKSRKALLVASTDLSHFFPLETANLMDQEMLRQIELFSPEGVFKAEESGTGSACGAAAVATVLSAARLLGGNAVHILHHSTSADETGDSSSVVGYGAAVIVKQ
jgi:AmmeMemoRadiSam system protein B